MGKYCCFFDPEEDYSEKNLYDQCPKCGRSYDFVLNNAPKTIQNGNVQYRVVNAIGRGFYGATFLCEIDKRFKTEKVLLKIIPKTVYTFFNKNFDEECKRHDAVASNTEHLVKINDAFETDVFFGDSCLSCYVEELQYIEGKIFDEYINDEKNIQPKIFAQLAIDLLKLWNELYIKNEFHNDLHTGNLIVEELDVSIQRVEAIYDKIRLVAIDLNSVSDESLSNYDTGRFSDRRNIANHINKMCDLLRNKYKNIDDYNDADFRLIETLNFISKFLTIQSEYIDIPKVQELIDKIKDEFRNNISYAPWKRPLFLSNINDAINSQILYSCHIPQLLVDPDNAWLNEMSKTGPQLITGMRGCGKTMLLKALDVHARLEVNKSEIVESSQMPDHFIGLFASCRELIDIDDIKEIGISKLILLYSVQTLRANRHLNDIIGKGVEKDFHINIIEALNKIFDIDLQKEEYLYSDAKFERYLSDQANHIEIFYSNHKLIVNCITAFEMLAQAFVNTSGFWKDKQVYFLLDDASTRYLKVNTISALLTKILFMSHTCAFKITTEMQTLYTFNSPGDVEMAQDTRDYQIFDLGADVFSKTRDTKDGKIFIQSIIHKRIIASNGIIQIPQTLDEVLGDCPLNEIARYIIYNQSGKSRKEVYYGASALAALCVGDIGDIIYLYDSIISENKNNPYPVDIKIQHQCFQQLCSRRMYNLERRNSKLREFVKAFSEASYRCLMDSFQAIKKDGKPSDRIRQYNGLYIRITSGDIDKQKERIRDLVDSGIFVFADGNGWPRSKSNDHDPILQLKLAFRKLFGLSNFIGLANADRFELSGDALEEWLERPSKEILLRNLGGIDDQILQTTAENEGINIFERTNKDHVQSCQISMFDSNRFAEVAVTVDNNDDLSELKKKISERAQIEKHSKLMENKSFDVAIFGMGFEERTFESIKRITEKNTFKKIVLIRYPEQGYADKILELMPNDCEIEILQYDDIDIIVDKLVKYNNILIDITGLYKPIIFQTIRNALLHQRQVTIVYTAASEYYPLNTDIQYLLDKHKEDISSQFINIMQELDTGDADSYININLLDDKNYDPIRPTTLIGFVSPKNRRIFSLLDQVEYDAIVLFVPDGKTPRDKLSITAGKIASTNYSAVKLESFNVRDPNTVLNEISSIYYDYYVRGDYNVEISLTGSKLQAVAASIFSTVGKISKCWYIKPESFDSTHFTKGTGITEWYTVKIK